MSSAKRSARERQEEAEMSTVDENPDLDGEGGLDANEL
jgi:hypothetical protein